MVFYTHNFHGESEILIQQLINGLILGSIYALIAVGYTMVYGVLRLINFAHGEVYMLGAYFALVFIGTLKLGFFVGSLLAIVCAMLLGILLERIAYRPLRKSSRINALITALGASLFLQNLAQIVWGPGIKAFPNFPFVGEGFFQLTATARLTYLQIVIFFVALLTMGILYVLIYKTVMGQAMRASAQDKVATELMGIDVNRTIVATFALGSALAAIAGILVGAYYNAIYPLMGFEAGIRAFAAAVMGGIGSVPGALIGGFVLGAAENLGSAYISSLWRDVIAYSILIIVMVFFPRGVFSKKGLDKI